MVRFILAFCFFFLNGCKKDEKDFIVGVTSGPHMEIMQDVSKRAKEQGLNLRIVEFNDFILPNEAVHNGDIALNSYQHAPFLHDQIKGRGYKLVSVGKTILLPIRLYSKKYKKLEEIPEGASIAIPNDPSNRSRALLLLHSCGLIKVKSKNDLTILDITENRKLLKINEIEAPLLPRVLPDVDAAIINTDWMLAAQENTKEFLAQESAIDNPYVNILVVKKGMESDSNIKKLLSVYYTEATATFIKNRFKGEVVASFSKPSHDACCE